ncbi:MAG: redoxin domain-containing protein [Verrucomicrobiaceae bacterium]|nr:MAG: redoxin domain-containing protein [Verrucomicrobiaceae bacterium]
MRLPFLVCLAVPFASVGTFSISAADSPRPSPGAAVAQRFQEMDKDKSGELRGEELTALPWLKLLDENGDGGVTLSEAESVLSKFANRRRPSEPETPVKAAVEDSPRQGPRLLSATQGGIGARLPEATLTDITGQKRALSDFRKKNGLIVALVGPDCPVSKRYFPTLALIAKEAETQEIGLLLLAPLLKSDDSLKEALSSAGISAPAAIDPEGAVARALGARVSTDVFLFDGAQTLAYRGAIDDQYGLGYQIDAPRERYLAKAVAAVLQQQVPEVSATEAPGCELDLSSAPALPSTITYHNRISRIVQANCQECHRAGGVAPFTLERGGQAVRESRLPCSPAKAGAQAVSPPSRGHRLL